MSVAKTRLTEYARNAHMKKIVAMMEYQCL